MKKVLFSILALLSITLFAVGCSSKDDEPTMTISPTDETIAVGESFKLTVKLKPSGGEAEITFISEDPSVATVNEKGVVTGVKAGTTKINARYKDIKKSCSVTVTGKIIPKLTISPTDTTVAEGKSFQIIAILTPSDSKAKITYTSEDPSVATVSEEGLVSALKEGTVKINAESGELKESCNVTVITPKLTVSPADTTIMPGKTFQLKAILTPSDNKAKITYTSEDPSVATVSEEGLVSALKEGTVKINAESGKLKGSCNVTIKKDILPTMKFEIEEISSTSATVKVIPPTEDTRWVCNIYVKETYDLILKNNDDIPSYNRKLWEVFSDGEVGSQIYQNYVMNNSFQGTQIKQSYEEEISGDRTVFPDDHEFVLTIYGIDKNGFETTEVQTKVLKTKPRVEDPNFKINITVNDASAEKFNATINPSDPNKQYFFNVLGRDYVDFYRFPDEKHKKIKNIPSEDFMVFDILNACFLHIEKVEDLLFKRGKVTIDTELFEVQKGEEYVILVWGWDEKNGRTTDIIYKDFKGL